MAANLILPLFWLATNTNSSYQVASELTSEDLKSQNSGCVPMLGVVGCYFSPPQASSNAV